jgi:hypothetical protein
MAKGKRKRPRGDAPKPPQANDRPATDKASVRPLLLVVAGLILSGAVAFLLFGGGSDEEETTSAAETEVAELAVPWLDPDRVPPVVGAIDVNPADDSVWFATNTGLFRIPPHGGDPEKITGTLTTKEYGASEISQELAIRFQGPDQLLASGHPPPDSPLPSVLGLIRSNDAGKTWTEISGTGTADYHALQLSGQTIIAGLFGEAGIGVSSDGGKTFETRTPPDPLVDLAVDPTDPNRWVATTATGLYISTDQGGTWRQSDPVPNSWLAWPEKKTLYRIDPGGPVQRSADGGRSWEERGSSGGEPQALGAAGRDELLTLLLDGTLKRSEDGGQTWTDLVTP